MTMATVLTDANDQESINERSDRRSSALVQRLIRVGLSKFSVDPKHVTKSQLRYVYSVRKKRLVTGIHESAPATMTRKLPLCTLHPTPHVFVSKHILHLHADRGEVNNLNHITSRVPCVLQSGGFVAGFRRGTKGSNWPAPRCEICKQLLLKRTPPPPSSLQSQSCRKPPALH